MIETPPLFAHLATLTDDGGLYEHALFTAPRVEHGYCADDVARALVVLCRNGSRFSGPDPDQLGALGADGLRLGRTRPPVDLARLTRTCAGFLERAQTADGRVVNRWDVQGLSHGPAEVGDCWGRTVWAMGTAAGRAEALAGWAVERFERGAVQRSPWPRAMAFAGLGAAEVLRVDPFHLAARTLLRDAAAAIGPSGDDPRWPWPEPRLTYANAVLPDLLLAAGDCLHDDALVDRGLGLLDWLLELQAAGGHLSLTPADGRGPGESGPAFDQQPIEASTLADACARAFQLTGDPRWAAAVDAAAAWFFGGNDLSLSLYDPVSGGCCDGLEAHGRNENQGAESTLALISTVQHSSRLAELAR